MRAEFSVDTSESGQRIDAVCAARFPDISRSQWTNEGQFICEGKDKKPSTKAKSDETWLVQYEEKMDLNHVEPWNFPLKILKESQSWVVIEKPEGVSVHPSSSDPSQQTILNALVYHFGNHLSKYTEEINGCEVARPGLVHRLDKGTSGVLLVAKTNKTHAYFQKHWSEVEKIYYAVVQGVPPKKGRIEAGILRDTRDRQKMSVSDSEKAREAVTFFERVEDNLEYSLLKVRIPTGRTHQIRVHLSSIGFPILGDEKYGGKVAERMMLHAHMLRFPDPDKKGIFTKVLSDINKQWSFFVT